MPSVNHPELRLAAERDRLLAIVRELRGEVARMRDLASSATPRAPVDEGAIRRDAITLALNGATRDQVEEELRRRHGELPPHILDSVFGDDARLEWGGAEMP